MLAEYVQPFTPCLSSWHNVSQESAVALQWSSPSLGPIMAESRLTLHQLYELHSGVQNTGFYIPRK